MIELSDRLDQLASLVDVWTRQFLEEEGISVEPFRQMVAYHLGWAGEDLRPLAQPVAAGKRLRPALCLLVAEAIGGDSNVAAAPAVAVELVHNFSLVHDDIQDASELRRHRPTVWALWGIPQAINVGDGLFALAQLVLASPVLPCPDPKIALSASERLNRTCLELVEGQFLDLELQQADEVTLAQYQRMVAGKTAALFRCSCELGALYASAPASQVAAFGAFGYQLGLAFQYQDDLLGAWGESTVTGKPRAADIRTRKKALPAVLAFEHLEGPEAARLRDLYRSEGELDDTRVEEALTLLERASVRATAERMVWDGYARALELLYEAAGDRPPPASLVDLCRSLSTRQA